MFNYPNKKSNFIQKTKYSNRGMELEEDINFANKYYLNNDIAVIHKKTYSNSNSRSELS